LEHNPRGVFLRGAPQRRAFSGVWKGTKARDGGENPTAPLAGGPPAARRTPRGTAGGTGVGGRPTERLERRTGLGFPRKRLTPGFTGFALGGGQGGATAPTRGRSPGRKPAGAAGGTASEGAGPPRKEGGGGPRLSQQGAWAAGKAWARRGDVPWQSARPRGNRFGGGHAVQLSGGDTARPKEHWRREWDQGGPNSQITVGKLFQGGPSFGGGTGPRSGGGPPNGGHAGPGRTCPPRTRPRPTGRTTLQLTRRRGSFSSPGTGCSLPVETGGAG